MLARFTTKIIADKTKYPFLLSNGNRVAQGELENGRHWVQWQTVPETVLPVCAGGRRLDVLRDTLPRVLVAKWRWSCTSIAATLIAPVGDDLAEKLNEMG